MTVAAPPPSTHLYCNSTRTMASIKTIGSKNDSTINTAIGTTTSQNEPNERSVLRSCLSSACGCQIDPSERLEYNYSYKDSSSRNPQPIPRIRAPGEHYIDTYNDQPFAFSFGTGEEKGVWMNSGDQAGSIMATLVWLLMTYSAVTVTLLTITEGIPPILGMIYTFLCAMALASHAKTSLTDPGSVPRSAVPQEEQRRESPSHSMCGQCQTFKPPMSHHCRICNRCVSRMDHRKSFPSLCIVFSMHAQVSSYLMISSLSYLQQIVRGW